MLWRLAPRPVKIKGKSIAQHLVDFFISHTKDNINDDLPCIAHVRIQDFSDYLQTIQPHEFTDQTLIRQIRAPQGVNGFEHVRGGVIRRRIEKLFNEYRYDYRDILYIIGGEADLVYATYKQLAKNKRKSTNPKKRKRQEGKERKRRAQEKQPERRHRRGR